MKITEIMKTKSLLLVIMSMGLPITILACVHKNATSDTVQSAEQVISIERDKDMITCLVMDSTNSLIGNAEVSFSDGNLTQLTRWDGRVQFVPKAEQVKLTITAEGYQKQVSLITVSDSCSTRIIVLHQDPKANRKKGLELTGYGAGVRYSRATKVYAESAEAEMEEMSVAMDYAADVVEKSALVREKGRKDVKAGSANGVSAGKLTAGEVNDFSKWLLWDGVLNGSHKAHISDWQIKAEERYMVQVTTNQGFPVVNRQVSLTDAQGNTIFQARTDNTGKAELWNGLVGKREKGQLFVQVENKREKAEMFLCKDMQTPVNHRIVLEEACETPTTADVFFIVDATGSMSDEIRYLQAEMQDVIRRSQSAVEGLQIRTGALMYRDHGDEYLTRISRLTEDIKTTQQFIDHQSAGGGGDYEEAIPEALLAALNAAGWDDEARARIAFLILDAPCHRDSSTLALLHEQILTAAAMGIRIVPVVCSGLQESGELLLRQLALATNGTSFFLTDDSGIGGTHLKPTTDTLVVEHLNDMMVRTIVEFASMPSCDNSVEIASETIEPFLPKPSPEKDDMSQPQLLPLEVMTVSPNPCSEYCILTLKRDVERLYLMDITGKTILSWGSKKAGEYSVSMSDLSVGAYFFMAYANGRWVTQKIIRK